MITSTMAEIAMAATVRYPVPGSSSLSRSLKPMMDPAARLLYAKPIDSRYNARDIRCMLEAHRVLVPLRGFLVLLFGVLVVFQTMSLPGQFAYMAQEDPEQVSRCWGC
jgi:hypothetical protein